MANQVAWEKRWAYCVLLGIGFGKKYPSLVAFFNKYPLQRDIFYLVWPFVFVVPIVHVLVTLLLVHVLVLLLYSVLKHCAHTSCCLHV
jgi:hypothetical protein